jgi:hypothetical protein
MLFYVLVALALLALYCVWRWHRWTFAVKKYGPSLPAEKWLSWPESITLVRKEKRALASAGVPLNSELPSSVVPRTVADDSYFSQ